jgi:hypothetical protein
MGRKSYTPEQIINKLREAEVLQSRWGTSKELHRKGLEFGESEEVVQLVPTTPLP